MQSIECPLLARLGEKLDALLSMVHSGATFVLNTISWLRMAAVYKSIVARPNNNTNKANPPNIADIANNIFSYMPL